MSFKVMRLTHDVCLTHIVLERERRELGFPSFVVRRSVSEAPRAIGLQAMSLIGSLSQAFAVGFISPLLMAKR